MTTKSFTLSLIILLMTIASVATIARRGDPVVVETNLENLPMEIAGFRATEAFFPDSVYQELNADKNVYRHYRSADAKQVDLYIGYYGTAKGGRTGHNPYACLSGAGWGIISSHRISLRTPSHATPVKVNYILCRKGDIWQSVLHWYQSGGDKILATGIQQNVQRFLNRILNNRNDGAFIRLSVTTDQSHVQEANQLTKFFAEEVLAVIPDYWPVEEPPHP